MNAIALNRSKAALAALLWLATGPGARALSTDPQQPVEVQADFAEMDDKAGTTVYIGNVIITQGSIRMTGDRMRATFDDQRALEDVFVDGRPAYFRQTPDGSREDIEGQALQVEYHARKNQLILVKDASLKQGERLFEGYRINYDTKKSVITGRGDPLLEPGQKPTGKPGGRIKVIIPPRKPGPVAAPAP